MPNKNRNQISDYQKSRGRTKTRQIKIANNYRGFKSLPRTDYDFDTNGWKMTGYSKNSFTTFGKPEIKKDRDWRGIRPPRNQEVDLDD